MSRLHGGLLAAAALLSMSASAEWRLIEGVDAMTDEVTREARVGAEEGGHAVSVIRRGDVAWLFIRLAGLNQFRPNDTPLIRVDGNAPVNTALAREAEETLAGLGIDVRRYEWNPSTLGVGVWAIGSWPDGACGLIGQIMHGNRMLVRYHPDRSTFRDIAFEISDGADVLRAALGLPDEACPPSGQ